MLLLTEKDVDRFWSKVDVRGPNDCWPWKAKARLDGGYGVLNVWVSANRRRNVVSSRISCYLAHGDPPHPGSKTLHSCDNPPCCNPAHLRWGTPLDNTRDAIERKRHVNPPDTHSHPEWNSKRLAAMPQGEGVHNSKLTEPVVREIWRLHLHGKNASEIAASVGYSVATVYDVCRGRSWRHLEGAPSIEELKAGGVKRGAYNQFSNGGDTRALNPRTKIPSSEIPAILARIDAGETLQSIGTSYGVQKTAIWRIKNDTRL